MAQPAHDQAAHAGRVAEAHLGLGGMDVDVHQPGVEVDEEGGHRVAAVGQHVGVGGAQGAGQQPVLHRAAVDEEVLVAGVAAVEGGQARVAAQAHAVAGVVDGQGVGLEVAAQHRGQPGEPPRLARGLGRQLEHAAAVDLQGEADGGAGHGVAAQLVGHRQGLGALAAHELEPGGGGVEQVAHLHPRPVRAPLRVGEGGRAHRAHGARVYAQAVRLAAGAGPAGERQARHRGDGGQGFAAEAQGGDVQEVRLAVGALGQLGGGVALHRQGQLARVQPGAVVGHEDAPQPAALDLHLHLGGARVQRVLHQLLDGVGGALDHLARGDAVHGARREAADGHASRAR